MWFDFFLFDEAVFPEKTLCRWLNVVLPHCEQQKFKLSSAERNHMFEVTQSLIYY